MTDDEMLDEALDLALDRGFVDRVQAEVGRLLKSGTDPDTIVNQLETIFGDGSLSRAHAIRAICRRALADSEARIAHLDLMLSVNENLQTALLDGNVDEDGELLPGALDAAIASAGKEHGFSPEVAREMYLHEEKRMQTMTCARCGREPRGTDDAAMWSSGPLAVLPDDVPMVCPECMTPDEFKFAQEQNG